MTADYRNDPEWIALQADLIAPRGADETPTAAMLRRIGDAQRMHEIEVGK